MPVGEALALRATPAEEGPTPVEAMTATEVGSVAAVAPPAMRDWARTPVGSPQAADLSALGPREGADCPMDQSRDRTLSATRNAPTPAPIATATTIRSTTVIRLGRSVPRLTAARIISPIFRTMSVEEIGLVFAAPKHAHGTRTPARSRPMRKVVKNARVTSAAIAPAGGTIRSRTTIENSATGTNRAKNAGRGTPNAVKSRSVVSRSRSLAIAARAKITASATAAAYPRPELLTAPLWSDLGS